MKLNHLPGVKSSYVETERLRMHMLSAGAEDGTPVLFIHGNFSSSTYFEELMVAMPCQYRSLAVDLRGYGQTEDKTIDATRGAQDWADDLYLLLQTLEIPSVHLVGWSAGGAAATQFTQDYPHSVDSLTLIAPVSPQGFGGSKDMEGNPCYEDYAGSGGGLVARDFTERVEAHDRSAESPFSPRNVIQYSYFAKPIALPREEELLSASLSQKMGELHYPGDAVKSTNWPYTAPGKFGPINALSAKYLRLNGLVDIAPKPPILWLRGDKDMIISNQSFSDPAVLGQQGLLPGWPGNEVYPAQPMLDQTRNLLSSYQAKGGSFQEKVMPGVGHSPFIEDQDGFLDIFTAFLSNQI